MRKTYRVFSKIFYLSGENKKEKHGGSVEFYLGQGSIMILKKCIRSLISVVINLLNFQIHFGSIAV